ncbi:uncharacterized protein LOC143294890 [Babylonia areolata]|uniref:uncharacterized protein LOC143294890 n=1 Tax=Babylonia areolata TaxID=304850 RepID=UPI003FD68CB9
MGLLINASSISGLTSTTPLAHSPSPHLLTNFTAAHTMDNTTTTTTTNAVAAAANTTTTTTTTTAAMTSLCGNGSMPLCPCPTPVTNHTRGMLSDEGSLDALLYIVVVLLFYAFSIVVLMVKYIRRENKEAYLRQYFDEFVARDQFQSARARNQICLKTIMERHSRADSKDYVQLSMHQPKVGDHDQVHEEGETGEGGEEGEEDALFSIPETISELVEDDEEMGFESAQDELSDTRSPTSTSVRTETEQVSSLEELVPREMPV